MRCRRGERGARQSECGKKLKLHLSDLAKVVMREDFLDRMYAMSPAQAVEKSVRSVKDRVKKRMKDGHPRKNGTRCLSNAARHE